MLRHSSHQKISGLLEQADIEALLNISHVTREHGQCLIHEQFEDQGLRFFSILERLDDLSQSEPDNKLFELIIKHQMDMGLARERFTVSEMNADRYPELVCALERVAPDRAASARRRYQTQFMESYEAQVEGPFVYRSTLKIIEVLERENREFQPIDLPDFSDPAIQSLDETGIDALIEALDKSHGESKSIDLPAYNDLDYKPYLIGDILVIEDYASAHHYVCQKSDNTLSWYVFENDYPTFGTANDDWIGDFLHEHQQSVWFKFQQQRDRVQPVIRYVDGVLVEADFNLHDLFLMHGSILDGMTEDGECEPPPFPEDVETLVKHWALISEPYALEVRSISPLLENLTVRGGRLGFDDYFEIDPDVLEKYVMPGTISKYNVESIEQCKIPIPLESDQKYDLILYLEGRRIEWSKDVDKENADLARRFIDIAIEKVHEAPIGKKTLSPKF